MKSLIEPALFVVLGAAGYASAFAPNQRADPKQATQTGCPFAPPMRMIATIDKANSFVVHEDSIVGSTSFLDLTVPEEYLPVPEEYLPVPEDYLPAPQELSPARPSFQNLQRLNTAMDKLSAHKWSTAIFCVSTAVISASGLSHQLQEVPDSLEVWTWLYFLSSHVMGVTSIEMAMKYRKNDEVSRTGFTNTALMAIAFAWATMYMAPFAPDAMNSYLFGNGVAFLTNTPAVFISLQQLAKLPKVFQSQQFKRSQDLATKATVALVIVFALYAGTRAGHIMMDPSHDRHWVIQATDDLELPHGKNFMTYNYYAGVFGSMAVSYGSLGITLFHKKLISAEAQKLMVGGPAAFYFVYQLYAWGNFW